MSEEFDIKKHLIVLCEEYVNSKINSAQEAIDNTQRSANKETKSSSGDKYETGRSMMQLEIEKYASQLNDGLNLKKALSQIDITKNYDKVCSGSLVITDQGSYFISISAGKLFLGNSEYIAISFSSPIGQILFNKSKDDEFEFRGKRFVVKSIA